MDTNSTLTSLIVMALIVVLIGVSTPVAAQSGVDASNLDIGDVTAPSEATSGETVTVESSAEIPTLPADWSADLEFTLYVDGNQVGTQEVSLTDGGSVDIAIQHQVQGSGEKEVYFDVSGQLTREGSFSEQSTSIDRTTQTVSIDVIAEDTGDDTQEEVEDTVDETEDTVDDVEDETEDTVDDAEDQVDDTQEESEETVEDAQDEAQDIEEDLQDGVDESQVENTTENLGTSVSIEGAAFVAPDSIQSEVDEVREDIPDAVTENAASQGFVVATSDTLYLVFTANEPQEGYASVEGTSYNLGDITLTGNQNSLDIQPIVADSVEFREPTQVSVGEVYENTDEYDRQYVEIDANHRSISLDYEESTYEATAGVLVDDPLAPEELFGAVGEQSTTALNELDGDNVGSILGDISRPHVVTASYETEYWDNTPVTMSGVTADPTSPAGEFIQAQQEDKILPTDSSTPILYTIDKSYDAQSVSGISEVSENPSSFDGETVSFEANLYMNTISTKRVAESATGSQLPPVDTILHGGVGWEQLPESRDDLIGIVAASSIEQRQLSETRRGKYRVIGEVVSTDRIEGDLPRGSVLIAYDLERVGSIETASAGDLIEEQSSAVSDTLERQANPEVDASTSATSDVDTETSTTEQTENRDGEETQDGGTDEVAEESDTESTSETGEEDETTSDTEQNDQSSSSGGVGEIISDFISGLLGTT